jgi:hypothetical protein
VNPQNPTGIGLIVSTTIKAVIVAVAALGVVHLSDTQIAAVTLAIAAVADLAVYFGWVKPRVDQQIATALATPAPPAALRNSRNRSDI